MSTSRDEAFNILCSKPMKSYLDHILHKYRIRINVSPEMSDEQVFTVGATVLINVLISKWKAKLRYNYVFALLDVAPIAAKTLAWRDSESRNILHLLCINSSLGAIRLVLETLGEELIHEKDKYGNYPVVYLLLNQDANMPNNMTALINLLSPNNMAPVIQLKDKIIAGISSKKEKARARNVIIKAMDLFAERDIYTDEDRKKVLALFRPRKRLQPGINILMMHIVTVMKFSPEDLEHVYTVIFNDISTLHCILNGKPDFLNYVLSHKVPKILTLAGEFEDFLLDVFNKLPNINFVPLFLTALRLYEPLTFKPLSETIDSRNSKGILIMAHLLKHVKELPKQYLYTLDPFKDSWIHSLLKDTGETPDSIFPIEDLPVEMIVYLIGFMSHQAATALSLVNKQFNAYINNHSVWSNMYCKYFPLRVVTENTSATKESPREVFYKSYNNKFRVRFNAKPLVIPPHRGIASLDLKEDMLVVCSTDHITLFDLTRPLLKIISPVNKPSTARVHCNIVFVYTANAIRLLSSKNLLTLRFFETPVPATIKDTFAVNDNWLVTPRCVYDWRTGHLVSTWDERLEHVTLRDNVYYGLSTTSLVIKDTRQNERVASVDVDVPLLDRVSLNTYGNQLYLAGDQIETYDLRYLRRMTVSPFTTDFNDSKVIDLVSMNVWTSTLVWDLIDNKWDAPPNANTLSYLASSVAVCNGREIISPFYRGNSSELFRIELPGNVHFPYGDFKCPLSST